MQDNSAVTCGTVFKKWKKRRDFDGNANLRVCLFFKQAQEGQGQISLELMHACHLSWTSVKVLTFSGVSSLVDETYRMPDGLPGREPL